MPFDYDVRLYNSAQTQVGISQNGGTTSEAISYTAAAGTYYVRVYGYSGALSTTLCYTLNVTFGTATKSVTVPIAFVSDNLTVSPNPVNSVANLSFKSKVAGTASVTITNQLGGIVLSKTITVAVGLNKNTIDVSNLANGLYYIKLQNDATIEMARIVVNK